MKKKLQMLVWILFGAATIVLFAFAAQKKKHARLAGIKIDIEGADAHLFADERQIRNMLKQHGAEAGVDPALLNLHQLEQLIEQNAWINKADLFIDNNQVLQVNLYERTAIARIFTTGGSSFYIDSTIKRLPLSDSISASVPVFSSFPSERQNFSGADSAILQQVKKLALFIQQDSVWQAQVEQIDIRPMGTFELVPALGNHIIVLGNTDSLQQKFDRLYSFYKHIWSKYGFEKYEKIDVQYTGQVVATRRGAGSATDSALSRAVLDAHLSGFQDALASDSFKAIEAKPLPATDSVKTTAKKATADSKSATKTTVVKKEEKVKKETKDNKDKKDKDKAPAVKDKDKKSSKENKETKDNKKKTEEKPKAVMRRT
jgi:cell division protein FtsQ